MAAVALVGASCSSNDENETNDEMMEEVTYTLDTESSSLKWHGEENAEHYHDGTIAFSEGTFTMKGGEAVSGSFEIDPNSIKPMTEGYPQEKMDYLKSHLLDTAFFFAAEYPNITVTTRAYKDGKLNTTINVRGIDITTDVPVTIETTENGATISGDFSIDFADTKMPYLVEPDPETGKPGAKSAFEFSMNLVLNKQ